MYFSTMDRPSVLLSHHDGASFRQPTREKLGEQDRGLLSGVAGVLSQGQGSVGGRRRCTPTLTMARPHADSRRRARAGRGSSQWVSPGISPWPCGVAAVDVASTQQRCNHPADPPSSPSKDSSRSSSSKNNNRLGMNADSPNPPLPPLPLASTSRGRCPWPISVDGTTFVATRTSCDVPRPVHAVSTIGGGRLHEDPHSAGHMRGREQGPPPPPPKTCTMRLVRSTSTTNLLPRSHTRGLDPATITSHLTHRS